VSISSLQSGNRSYPVGAAARPGDEVVLTLDIPAGSEKVAKDLQSMLQKSSQVIAAAQIGQ